MSATVKKITLTTPAAVGSTAQFSALERCRVQASISSDAASAAQSASALAQGSASAAMAARDAAMASIGAVKVTQNDAVAGVLNAVLTVSAPLSKTVLSPGGDESLNLSLPGFTGATASAPGAAGAVPAPQAGGERTYLRGDATWQTLDRESLGLAAVEDTWTMLDATVVMISMTQAAVPGDWTGLVLPGGSPGRAIKPDQPAESSGYVAGAVHDAATARTVITVEGFPITAQCSRLWVGQDPRNAPSSSAAGSDIYLVNTFNCLLY